jgi:hypothetical protein
MRNGRFDTPKCRDKVQKMGCCAHIPQSSPSPCNMQGPSKTKKKFPKNLKKKHRAMSIQAAAHGPRPASDRWSSPAQRPLVTGMPGDC